MPSWMWLLGGFALGVWLAAEYVQWILRGNGSE